MCVCVCQWTFRFRQIDNAWGTIVLQMDRIIRESGDRITSSGNWFRNALAWFTYLCTTDGLVKALRSWLNNRGKHFYYKSARDRKKYHAVFAFEGDDTLGKVTEAISDTAEAFFRDWGWAPELKFVSSKGDAMLTFVGYQMLISDGKAVITQHL